MGARQGAVRVRIPSRLSQPPNQRNRMPSLRLFTLQPVTRHEDYPTVPIPRNVSQGTGALSAAGPGAMHLAQIRHTVPDVLTPTYLPSGFSFTWGHARDAKKILLVYKRNLGNEFGEKLHIIEQSTPGRISVPIARYHETTVGEERAFYVDGAWVVDTSRIDTTAELVTADWQVGHSASLIFERNNYWIMLYIRNPGRLAENIESELVSIGRSLGHAVNTAL